MAEQRQPFRFRLPWLAASQPQPALVPRPRAPTPDQAQAQAQTPAQPAPTLAGPRPRTPVPPSTSGPAQRPPFRPAGVAPPARAEPPPSPSRTTQARVPPPSSTQPAPAPQIPDTVPRSLARRPSPQPQEPLMGAPKSPAKPTPSQPTLKSPPRPKQEPATTDVSQTEEQIRSETQTQPTPPRGPQHIQVTAPIPPAPEKVVDSLPPQEKKLPKPEASRELAKEAFSPKPETKQHPLEVEEPREMPVVTHSEESKQKAIVAPDEIVIEKKEVHSHGKANRTAHRPVVKEKEGLPKPVLKNEHPYSVITLSGENTGAIMHLNRSESSSKGEKPIHIHRAYKISAEAAEEGGESSLKGGKSQDQAQAPQEEQEVPETMYVNNNVQGINNSLLFNSNVKQRNPGVHLARARLKPEEPVVKSSKEKQTSEARKAEVVTTPTERLAYAPTIRRRCLQGLFLESSDSDPQNPEKPRRHGCRVGCSQKSKDGKKIDVQ